MDNKITIKESFNSYSEVKDMISRVDYNGNNGLEYLKEKGYIFVDKNSNKKVDIGISQHDDKVKNMPKNKCILLKREPPIYNALWGIKLSNSNHIKKYLAVMSTCIEKNLEQYHFIIPRDFTNVKYFRNEKEKLLCMVLRNKKINVKINNLFPSLKKYSKNSLLDFRERCDYYFCKNLKNSFYNSYGKGWCNDCFCGSPESEFETISKYKFNFCPENSRFEGYLTEKAFNAIICGSIPIYLGAYDVKKYLPPMTFIDYTKYKHIDDLITDIKYMDSIEYMSYLNSMSKFLKSKESDCFSSVTFAKKLIKVIEESI